MEQNMIKKQSIFYGLLILLLASLGQQAIAMKWANGFRLGMKGLNYGGTLLGANYLVEKDKSKFAKISRSVNEESENHVLDVVHNAYPELKNRPIKVVSSPINWAGMSVNNTDHIFVNTEDKEIVKAKEYKKKNTAKELTKELIKDAAAYKATIPEMVALCEISGIAMKPTTIDAWNGIILHEASHILHKDDASRRKYLGIIPIALLATTEAVKTKLGLHTLLSTHSVGVNFLKGIGYISSLPIKIGLTLYLLNPLQYLQEYRADQDVIERVQNPEVLKAMSNLFESLPDQKHTKPTIRQKIENLIPTHPSWKTRAKYFAEAAEKLEQKQAQLNQNGAVHD